MAQKMDCICVLKKNFENIQLESIESKYPKVRRNMKKHDLSKTFKPDFFFNINPGWTCLSNINGF